MLVAKRGERGGDLPGYRVHFWCPGCKDVHGILTGGTSMDWGFNDNYEKPTFTPSVLVKFSMGNMLPQDHPDFKKTDHVCHSYVTDGMIQFLNDSTHELAGQTVPLPEWDTRYDD